MNEPSSLGDGRYLVLGVLGAGGTSRVYRCRDKVLNVERAVKVLDPRATTRADLRHRMLTEARVLASLRHPNIVTVFDHGRDPIGEYIVSELVNGDSLHHMVRRNGPIAESDAVRWTLEVLAGLAVAHERGVVHRDIKPHNILIDPAHTARIIDFGIALDPDNTRITTSGTAMGTLAYMAPEQRFDASRVDLTADIYAVGATLFNILTATNAMDLAFAPPDSSRWSGVPVGLRSVLQRAVRERPEARFASATDMGEALRATARP